MEKSITHDIIIRELQGTCKSLLEVLEYYGREDLEDNSEFLAELDDRIFCCDCCGWWMEQSEMSCEQDWICEDCADE